MLTQRLILTVDPAHDEPLIRQAAAVIRAGGLVAFPTETVYGLGADALNPVAVRRIYEVKRRPAWDPLIVHVVSRNQMRLLVREIPPHAEALIDAFMPGPLTLILPRSERVSDIITAGRDTVAVRMPVHPVARALIEYSQTPIAAPSANRFGRPSPTNADHVLDDLAGEIEMVLDGGETPVGVESTIVDMTTQPPTLLRPGGIPLEAIESVIGTVRIFGERPAEGTPLPSPGTAPRHYAPRVPVLLTAPEPNILFGAVKDALSQYAIVGVMIPEGWLTPDDSRVVRFNWGPWGDWETLARRLFEGLRWLESKQVHAILCPLPPAEGLARALRDRLERAAHEVNS